MRFADGEIYHIYNRGVEGRDIFLDEADYQRFLQSLKEFNTTKPVTIRELPNLPEVRLLGGEVLVSIISYILMKNHVHLLIKCIDEKYMSTFLRKVFTGYTNYFNVKYKRSGVLFQGKSKSTHIKNDAQMSVIIRYILLNGLDYAFPEWRIGKIENIQNAHKTLLNYQWSGLQELLGKEDYGILDKKQTKDFIPDTEEFIKSLLEWSSRDFEDFKSDENIFIE